MISSSILGPFQSLGNHAMFVKLKLPYSSSGGRKKKKNHKNTLIS